MEYYGAFLNYEIWIAVVWDASRHAWRADAFTKYGDELFRRYSSRSPNEAKELLEEMINNYFASHSQ